MITQEVAVERVRLGEVVQDHIAVSVTMSFGKAPRMVIMTGKRKKARHKGREQLPWTETSEYTVENLPTPNMDGIGFTLYRKPEDVLRGEPDRYNVFVAKRPDGDLCDCKGFEFHRRCKHTSALRAVVADAEV